MLSFTKGQPIGIIKNGKYNNQIIYVDTESDENLIKNNPLDILGDVYKNSSKSKLSKNDMAKIKNALLTGDEEYEESLYDIITDAKKRGKELSKKEFKIFDDGRIQPLPRFNKTERCFIAGQTECGKTYYCKKYLEQLRLVHPDKKIYIVSDVEDDPELDDIPNVKRLKLEGLEDKEIPKPELFDNSIVLFDDIDSIQNKKVYNIVQNLRDALLKRGRHNDISVIITSHLLTNYKDTRVILNECNAITIFCRSGSSYGINYLLKKYVGLNNTQIQKLVDLPSRWVTIYKNHPQFVIYEKGVYLL